MELAWLGKLILIVGLFLVLFGLLLIFGGKLPYFGKLPGDILIEGKNFKFYFPLVTFLIISLLLTIILNIFLKR
jgi:hypothetical protein